MTPCDKTDSVTLLHGDCREVLKTLDAGSVNCCVTSPPYYGLRDYGVDGQIGLEPSPQEYVAQLVSVFREVRRVLRDDGTLWLNLGDSYARMQEGNVPQSKNIDCLPPVMRGRIPNAGLKPKDIIGIPWRVAFALQADGWYLRQDIIWHKPNPMPESVTDRCTKAHEYIFLLAKSDRYYYDAAAISEPAIYGDNGSTFDGERDMQIRPNTGHTRRKTVPRGGFSGKTDAEGAPDGRNAFRAIRDRRNKRSVWTVSTQPYREAHFATFPPALITPCILAGCPVGGTVLDTFGGSGTTGMVAAECGRNAILIELNEKYIEMQRTRTAQRGFRL